MSEMREFWLENVGKILLASVPMFFGCALGIAQNPPGTSLPQPSQPLLYWAYPVNPPSDQPSATPADETPRHVPGSSATFLPAQVNDQFNAPDSAS